MERWGCIRAGLVLFQHQFLTELVLALDWGEVLLRVGLNSCGYGIDR